jgi:hypothetical protein
VDRDDSPLLPERRDATFECAAWELDAGFVLLVSSLPIGPEKEPSACLSSEESIYCFAQLVASLDVEDSRAGACKGTTEAALLMPSMWDDGRIEPSRKSFFYRKDMRNSNQVSK